MDFSVIIVTTSVAILGMVFKKRIRQKLQSCYDWWKMLRDFCTGWLELEGTNPHTRLGEVATLQRPSASKQQPEDKEESPQTSEETSPRPSTSEEAQQYSSVLSTVEEERTSQLTARSNSQNTLNTAAESIAEIASSTVSLNEDAAQKKRGSTSESPKRNPELTKSTASPARSYSPAKLVKEKRKSDSVHVDIEEEVTVSVEVETRKDKSPKKATAAPPPIPARGSPKPLPKKPQAPRCTSPDIQPYESYVVKQNRLANASVTYSQGQAGSSDPRVEIPVDANTYLLSLKEPEPIRAPRLADIRQDSSESNNSESPYVFQHRPEVHRAQSTESEPSSSVHREALGQPQLGSTEEVAEISEEVVQKPPVEREDTVPSTPLSGSSVAGEQEEVVQTTPLEASASQEENKQEEVVQTTQSESGDSLEGNQQDITDRVVQVGGSPQAEKSDGKTRLKGGTEDEKKKGVVQSENPPTENQKETTEDQTETTKDQEETTKDEKETTEETEQTENPDKESQKDAKKNLKLALQTFSSQESDVTSPLDISVETPGGDDEYSPSQAQDLRSETESLYSTKTSEKPAEPEGSANPEAAGDSVKPKEAKGFFLIQTDQGVVLVREETGERPQPGEETGPPLYTIKIINGVPLKVSNFTYWSNSSNNTSINSQEARDLALRPLGTSTSSTEPSVSPIVRRKSGSPRGAKGYFLIHTEQGEVFVREETGERPQPGEETGPPLYTTKIINGVPRKVSNFTFWSNSSNNTSINSQEARVLVRRPPVCTSTTSTEPSVSPIVRRKSRSPKKKDTERGPAGRRGSNVVDEFYNKIYIEKWQEGAVNTAEREQPSSSSVEETEGLLESERRGSQDSSSEEGLPPTQRLPDLIRPAICIDECSTQSFSSSADDDPALLGSRQRIEKDLSENSFDFEYNRQRQLSEGTSDDVRSPLEEVLYQNLPEDEEYSGEEEGSSPNKSEEGEGASPTKPGEEGSPGVTKGESSPSRLQQGSVPGARRSRRGNRARRRRARQQQQQSQSRQQAQWAVETIKGGPSASTAERFHSPEQRLARTAQLLASAARPSASTERPSASTEGPSASSIKPLASAEGPSAGAAERLASAEGPSVSGAERLASAEGPSASAAERLASVAEPEPIVSEEVLLQEDIIEVSEEYDNLAVNIGPDNYLETFRKIMQEQKRSECRKKAKHVMTPEKQVRVLTLNEGENRSSDLYRLEQKWTLEFRPGASLFGKKIDLWCNYPIYDYKGEKFYDRKGYCRLRWIQDGESNESSVYAQIECKRAGSYRYYFKEEGAPIDEEIGEGYFLVDPKLKVGELYSEEYISLDSVQCHTVISKNLGSFSTWAAKLEVSRRSGYNMIHFTPVQELGASNSAYCIKDQLKLNPNFKKENGDPLSWPDLKQFIRNMCENSKILSICDIVLNHTANETPWLKDYPEASYNCAQCTYMRPAYLLDGALAIFQEDIKNGLYETRGIPRIIETEDHLNAMRYHLHETVLKELKLHELYICDVKSLVSKFIVLAHTNSPSDNQSTKELLLVQDPQYRRLTSTVDLDLAIQIYNCYRPGCFDEGSRLSKSCEEFKNRLDHLNQSVMDKLKDHLNAAVENIIAGVRYWRVSSDGPRLGEITDEDPLIGRYFTDHGNPKTIEDYEKMMYGDESSYLMAHNGWVMDSDPLVNFAGPESNVYLRRELIPWGDNVKLRYGDSPKDSPYLWDMMKMYVTQTAQVFHGVRLDNCHGTPSNVADYMLECARKVRPDLYVVAELFTNSQAKDNYFVNRLGITSLIREAMNAPNAHELGRLIHRYGGKPAGSFFQQLTCELTPSVAHALFFDQTHDNKSPVDVTSVYNMLPSAALVCMANCAVGSNRGYDELVPHPIDVVKETREYTEWTQQNLENNPRHAWINSGILKVKKILNDLHFKMGEEGFNETYVCQVDEDIVSVTRHSPVTHEKYLLFAFTAYGHPSRYPQANIGPICVEGNVEIVLEATLSHADVRNGGSKYARHSKFEKNDRYINGLSEYEVQMKENPQLEDSEVIELRPADKPNSANICFKNFTPGSIIILKLSYPKDLSTAVSELRKLTDQFSYAQETELTKIIKKLDLRSMNRVLYKCDEEEKAEGNNFDVYSIPNYGKTVYAGLQGFISILSKIRPMNDLGHPMCENIRQGDWMIEYIYNRLKLDVDTESLGNWIEKNAKYLKMLPAYYKPAYFDLVISGIYSVALEHCYEIMSKNSRFIKDGSEMIKLLAMGSIQFAGYVESADIPPLFLNLRNPKPLVRKDKNGRERQICVSLSAGLPHFSVGYTRNWGRDTFIALRGLLLLTGRYQEARYLILSYGSVLRHGLIPNLLDGGLNARYNCRDAVWWWLYCIKCYVEEAPNGHQILKDQLVMMYPQDDSMPYQGEEVIKTLENAMQVALNRHFEGIKFRERKAGDRIDAHMTSEGFNIEVGVDAETGFVYGGNEHNCGTWMDKMGSSAKAGNKGKPATPRDGSAVEIIGLSKCVITWLARLANKKQYMYEGVEYESEILQGGEKVRVKNQLTFADWATKIRKNFEKYFWIGEKNEDDEGVNDEKLINKRGIYKDCYGATQEWSDYQLRCNFPIAMVVAPELFRPKNAWTALENAEKYLLGPLGMKTLDPDDWAYRGDYDNSNDSDDPSVAQGFNYHQGPEWVWPIGYFLRAKLFFAKKNDKLDETIAETKRILSRHYVELQNNDWRGLPELTNSNGSFCVHSSRTQAWSMSCVLEVLHDLERIDAKRQEKERIAQFNRELNSTYACPSIGNGTSRLNL